MADHSVRPPESPSSPNLAYLSEERRKRESPSLSGGDGGGTFDPMEARVVALEQGMKDMQGILKELRDGQHAAALAASQQAGEINTKLAGFDGKLTNLGTLSDGLRRDLEKLPSKFDVATIMVLVIGGLAGAATLVKTVWPMLTGH